MFLLLFLFTVVTLFTRAESTHLEETDVLQDPKDPRHYEHIMVPLMNVLLSQAQKIDTLTAIVQTQGKEITALQLRSCPTSNEEISINSDDSGKAVSKRIVLHSESDILHLVTTHSAEIKAVQNDVAILQSNLPTGGSGSTYIRWGRNMCPGNGTELVYSGFAAGSHYTHSGAAANYICLSPDPLWEYYTDAQDSAAPVYGAEYEFSSDAHSRAFFHKHVFDENAPCSVCRSIRPTVIMIPGRNRCYSGWTQEYKGYLVAGYYGHAAASEFVCLDENPDVLPGGHADENGKLFYYAEARCGSLTCPPYIDGRELTCVVCSK